MAAAIGLCLWLGLSLAALAAHWRHAREQADLQRRASELHAEDAALRHNRRQLDQRTRSLEARQHQLEEIVHRTLGFAAPAAAAPRPAHSGGLVPLDRRLAAIEQRQLGFATAVTRSVDARLTRSQAVLRRLGFDPVRPADAQGGPFVAYDGPMPAIGATSPTAHLAALDQALGHWRAAERLLAAVPAGLPVLTVDLTSPFGVRYDPFTHRPAVHPGQDFRGPTGSPILAAGVGRVIHAGWLAGYGRAVMVDHGHRLVSLYGHMSRTLVQDGQLVRRGDRLGLIGSTGRSTGPHLHFEVRLAGRSIDPWPLLEMNHVR